MMSAKDQRPIKIEQLMSKIEQAIQALNAMYTFLNQARFAAPESIESETFIDLELQAADWVFWLNETFEHRAGESYVGIVTDRDEQAAYLEYFIRRGAYSLAEFERELGRLPGHEVLRLRAVWQEATGGVQ